MSERETMRRVYGGNWVDWNRRIAILIGGEILVRATMRAAADHLSVRCLADCPPPSTRRSIIPVISDQTLLQKSLVGVSNMIAQSAKHWFGYNCEQSISATQFQIRAHRTDAERSSQDNRLPPAAHLRSRQSVRLPNSQRYHFFIRSTHMSSL